MVSPLALFFAAFFLNYCQAVPGLKGACRTKSYKIVENFNVTKYLGQWYEITHSESFYYDRNCVCTTAEYVPRPDDNKVSVVNTCRKFTKDADPTVAIGRARQILDGTGKLRVSFLPFDVPFINRLFEANYDVVALDTENYGWAAILSCSRLPRVGGSNVWILSRTPTLPESTIESINAELTIQGIDLSDQVRTAQQDCWNNSSQEQNFF